MAQPELNLKGMMESFPDRSYYTKEPKIMMRRATRYGSTHTNVEKYYGNLRGRFSWEVIIGFRLPKMGRRVIHCGLTQTKLERYDEKLS